MLVYSSSTATRFRSHNSEVTQTHTFKQQGYVQLYIIACGQDLLAKQTVGSEMEEALRLLSTANANYKTASKHVKLHQAKKGNGSAPKAKAKGKAKAKSQS